MPDAERFETVAEVERVDLSADAPEDAIRRAHEACLGRALERITQLVGEGGFEVDAVQASPPFQVQGQWYVSASIVVWVRGSENRPWPSLP